MKRYDSYKDSGVQWIEKIPSHWTSVPIKYSVNSPYNSFIDGDWIESNVIVSDGIRYLTTGNVGVLKYKEQGNGFISEATFEKLNCAEVFPGDLLISRLNDPIGRTCMVPNLGYRIVVAVDNVIYRPNENLYDKQFLVYQMNCKPYADSANFIARGSTMPRISRTTLGQFKIIVPPIGEQQAIASYLDKRCGEIDKAIAKQQKRIELLQELRQSIITNAVTRGINPDASLKDSGVEWIGEVPSHWEVIPFKRIMRIKNGQDYKDFAEEDGYPVVGSGGCFAYCSKYIYDGEAILLGRKGTIDKPLYINGKFWTVDTMFYAYPKTSSNIKFMYYQSLTIPFDKYKTSTALPSMTQTDLGYNIFCVPPIGEQQAIASYLDKRCEEIDKAIAKQQKRIELLQELKQSIITEVVTGKRKVC